MDVRFEVQLVTPAGTIPVDCDAVLFDMDGTIVDSRACVERKWRQWSERHGLDGDMVLRVAHGRQLDETIRRVAPYLDLAYESAVMMRWEEQETTGLRVVPGAADLLAALPIDAWAIVTSAWRRLAEIRMRHVGLPTPRVLVTADDGGPGKPAPDGYRKAARRLARPADRCVVVEDTPVGIQAARAAGMRVIGVATTFPAHALDADWVIDDLTPVRVHVPATRG